MAKTVLTTGVLTLPAPAGYASTGLDVTTPAQAADVSNGNAAPNNGKLLLVAFNSGGVSYTVTVSSAPDPYNRSSDITADTVLAGQTKIYGPFPSLGWKQAADGMLYFSASNAAIKFSVVPLP